MPAPVIGASSSLGGDAAVDDEPRAGHEGGVVGGEEHDPLGDVARRTHAADRQALDDLTTRRLDVVGAEIARPRDQHLIAHIGVDCPGMHRVDPNAVSLAGKFERGRLGEQGHPAFGHRIERVLRRTDEARGRGEVDDGAPVRALLRRLPQRRQAQFGAEEHAGQVDCAQPLPFGKAGGFDILAEKQPSVIDQDVEPAETAQYGGDCGGPILLAGHQSEVTVRRHHTDGGGNSDHVFTLLALLGFQFAPRIPDLKNRRLYSFAKPSAYRALEPLIAGRINLALIRTHWSEILRIAASIRTGTLTASLIMRQLASYPRQNGVAATLRELGRLERTLFTLDWIEDPGLRRDTGRELNKGESRNGLARAVFIHRLGEIRDRTYENQQHRASGLNLLVTAITLWNTCYLNRAIAALRGAHTVTRH